MKTKILFIAVALLGCQIAIAQQGKPVVLDSTIIVPADLMQQKVLNKEAHKQKEAAARALRDAERDRKNAQKQLERAEESRKKAEKEGAKAEKVRDKAENEKEDAARKIEKEQNKIAKADKSIEKLNRKIDKAEKDFDKMQTKLDKATVRGKLSEVEIQQDKIKLSKKLLQVKELEADLVEAQEKLGKLQK